MTAWLWTGFIAAIAAILAFDLAVVHRRPRPIGVYEALAWTGFWVALALGFNVGVYYLYEDHLFGAGLTAGHGLGGGRVSARVGAHVEYPSSRAARSVSTSVDPPPMGRMRASR